MTTIGNTELDILQSARVLIKHMGYEVAEVLAQDRARHLLNEGDSAGHDLWRKIAAAIDWLRSTWPANDNPPSETREAAAATGSPPHI